MSENLYNSAHKTTSESFRQGYDNIKWYSQIQEGDVMSWNPMISTHGPGPEGMTCGECSNMGNGRSPHLLYGAAQWIAPCAESRKDACKCLLLVVRNDFAACGLWKEKK